MNKNKFEEKIKPIFTYVGTIGAALMCLAYIIVVFVLIQGFNVQKTLQLTIFACVNAAVGFCVMQMLKIQGISFAKELPENKELLSTYYNKKTKDKKARSINYFWVTSVIRDLFTKCLTLGVSTAGLIYLVITGSGDYKLLGLAAVNLIMFICFGLLQLVKAYEYFNNSHIPYIREQLAEQAVTKGAKDNDCLREQQSLPQSSGTGGEE